MATVGVIGAGLMGTAITKRLLGARLAVVAYDIDRNKRAAIGKVGARIGESVQDVAAVCETIILSVFSTDQVEQVVEGPAGILAEIPPNPPEQVILCTSTCDPERLASLAARTAPKGRHLLEVPISGTSRQVEQGEGVGFVGGDAAIADRVGLVLDTICARRYHVGPVGNGSRAKLAVNLVLGLNRAAIGEGIVFADRLGLDRSAFLEIARGSAAYSQVMDVKGPLMAERRYRDPQSRVDQSLKDFKLIIEQARLRGQQLPFANVYACMLEDCITHGEGEWDNAAITEAIGRQQNVAEDQKRSDPLSPETDAKRGFGS
jgi:L-threonate 2-dehydrogenase